MVRVEVNFQKILQSTPTSLPPWSTSATLTYATRGPNSPKCEYYVTRPPPWSTSVTLLLSHMLRVEQTPLNVSITIT